MGSRSRGADGIRTTSTLAAAFGCSMFSACIVGDLEFDTLTCPCAEGYRCDEGRDLCVLDDAQEDVGATDLEAEPIDLGRPPPDLGLEPSSACDSSEATSWAFCDGFEALSLTNWIERGDTGGSGEAFVERQTEVVFRGEGALRARISGSGTSAAVYAGIFEPPADEVIWMRGYFLLPEDAGEVDFMSFGDALNVEAVVLASGDSGANVHDHRGEGSFNFKRLGVQLPKDRWFCAILRIDVGTLGLNTVFINDVRIDAVDFNTTVERGHTRLDVGFLGDPGTTTSSRAREIFVDEVAVSTSTLSCEAL